MHLSYELTLPVLRPGLHSCLLPSSLHAPSSSFSAPSPCCERDSDSDWAREWVSEPWLRGEDERDGDSRNRRMAGWFSTAGSLLEECWDEEEKLLVASVQNIDQWLTVANSLLIMIYVGSYLREPCYSSTGIVISHDTCPQLVHHPPGFIETLQHIDKINDSKCCCVY